MSPEATLSREHANRLLRAATAASVATAFILIIAKLAAWALSGAVSILASLIDSMMDALASIVNLLAVRYAMMPADDDHRFGHGKAEALAALGQATFIAGSAVFLILHAVDRLLHPQPLQHLDIGVVVIVGATALTLLLLGFQRYVIKRTRSTAIRADALHYATDVLVNIGILLALALSSLGWLRIDAVIGILVAIYVSYSAWKIGKDAVNLLMDRELPAKVQSQIRTIIAENPGVAGVHDLRTRQSGPDIFIQMHLEFPADIPLSEAHDIGDEVEIAIRKQFPNAEVMIHHDPVAAATGSIS